jgi:hypothetical protein
MKRLIGQVTSVCEATGKRKTKKGPGLQDVLVKCADAEVMWKLREKDLYIIAFTNKSGTYYFKDDERQGVKKLPFSASYTSTTGVGILADSTSAIATARRSKQSIEQAIRDLENYANDTSKANELKKSVAIIAYLISESMRFKKMYKKMCDVTKGADTFTFAEFEIYVKNWSDISTGKLPAGTTQAELSTYSE